MIAIADCLLEHSKPDQSAEGSLSEVLQDKNQLVQGRDALRANAVMWYERAIDRNDPIAMKKRAELLVNGSSSEDRSSAIILYRKSAELGYQEAIRFLWGAYLTGDLVLQDYSEAYRYLSQGAELGDAYSQYELGQLLSEKSGYPQDLVAAYKWFILANVLGSSNSKKDEIQKRMTSEQVLEGQAQARKWMEEKGRSLP
jgi:TPR repeat protein